MSEGEGEREGGRGGCLGEIEAALEPEPVHNPRRLLLSQPVIRVHLRTQFRLSVFGLRRSGLGFRVSGSEFRVKDVAERGRIGGHHIRFGGDTTRILNPQPRRFSTCRAYLDHPCIPPVHSLLGQAILLAEAWNEPVLIVSSLNYPDERSSGGLDLYLAGRKVWNESVSRAVGLWRNLEHFREFSIVLEHSRLFSRWD